MSEKFTHPFVFSQSNGKPFNIRINPNEVILVKQTAGINYALGHKDRNLRFFTVGGITNNWQVRELNVIPRNDKFYVFDPLMHRCHILQSGVGDPNIIASLPLYTGEDLHVILDRSQLKVLIFGDYQSEGIVLPVKLTATGYIALDLINSKAYEVTNNLNSARSLILLEHSNHYYAQDKLNNLHRLKFGYNKEELETLQLEQVDSSDQLYTWLETDELEI